MKQDKIQKLIDLCIKNKNTQDFPYLKISDQNKYAGWVSNFNLCTTRENKIIKLNLTQEKELFLLFVLATAWSRSGLWENAVFLTSHYLLNDNWEIKNWLNDDFVEAEKNHREMNCKRIQAMVKGISPRKKVSFRSDIFPSIQVLAKNWNEIKSKLENTDKTKKRML